jgi:DNA-binding MarR family transcriptional regulator
MAIWSRIGKIAEVTSARAAQEQPDAHPARVTYQIKRLELAIRAEMDALVGVFGLTAMQYTALSVLARHPGMSSAQLSRRSFVSAQAGNEMIGLLQRKGLISRTPDKANRRILRISLTAGGRRVLAKCDSRVDQLERRMLEPLSAASVARLRSTISACTSTLTEPAEGPALS